MANSCHRPWLTIVGLNEDGLAGLSLASRNALDAAEFVFGGPRHLALANPGSRGKPWPVPFDLAPMLEKRGRAVVVLASGDPFWFGAGGSIAQHLDASEWTAHPAPSTFSLAAARLGWRLEDTVCLGLHAAPFERLVPVLANEQRIICLVRDAEAVTALCRWLTSQGWEASSVTVLTALGGPNERLEHATAAHPASAIGPGPFAVALVARGNKGLSRASGLYDGLFVSDGQMTKRPMRALALSALGPRTGEHLWDIGAGSGSISVEWSLAGGTATALEQNATRTQSIRANAERFGMAHRIVVVNGSAPEALAGLPPPNAVFVGGGLTESSFEALWHLIPAGTRLVAHAVSLETQGLLSELHAAYAGNLERFEISQVAPLGNMRSWQAARPIVQWATCK
ncbi:MAG: precorrin-6y C5,15-methyltransferase (decarboxylating) subunit CbiE [Hyphomicrobium sp.]|nr:precorrin-6y C5,15-methyltransferase (decarboxylating) subunit CbiE [Hyphomicrobium sp.]